AARTRPSADHVVVDPEQLVNTERSPVEREQRRAGLLGGGADHRVVDGAAADLLPDGELEQLLVPVRTKNQRRQHKAADQIVTSNDRRYSLRRGQPRENRIGLDSDLREQGRLLAPQAGTRALVGF